MRWPALVPRALCKTPIQVTLRREGIDEDGAPVAALTAVSFERGPVSAAQNSRAAVMYFFIIRQP